MSNKRFRSWLAHDLTLFVKFAMDDFGTGHSSLSGLKRLPLDQIKIDQSFVHDISENDDAAVIIQTIIAMGNNLGMEVIAEGVETAEQKDFLLQHHCVNFQGYFFGDPMPLDEFERVIAITLPLIRNGSIDALSSPN
ncbi:EAL domain-containing protein [Ferrovum sp.]|uniref:EAL domain-containing protein n=1 Tax=Ferrovum sp. TaxID=2609467 RepID=UPI002607CBB4|nr:EAL domain-containing protein [Ferrovum sp.]